MDEIKLIPGATVTAEFTLPVDSSMIRSLKIDYSQDETWLFSKTKGDCELNGTTGTVKLSQEDTLKFDDSAVISVQIVVLTEGGETIPGEPVTFTTGVRQKREVLV